MAITDKISMKAMTAFEKATGKNAFKTIGAGADMTATDLVGVIFMYLRTSDPAVTLESVENMSSADLEKVMADALKTDATS